MKNIQDVYEYIPQVRMYIQICKYVYVSIEENEIARKIFYVKMVTLYYTFLYFLALPVYI